MTPAMSQSALLWPVFAQALITFVVLIVMAQRRSRSMAAARIGIDDPDLALRRNRWSDEAMKASNNYENQFELPVLFYAVVAFALITRSADVAMVGLAWAFVVSRVAQTAVHLGANVVKWRFLAFLVGALVLLAMWGLLAWRVAGAGA